MTSTSGVWKKCSICKKDIPQRAKYFMCSVSTCQHPRTGFQFCSVECWDAHLGYVSHRESWAQEAVAPSVSEVSAGSKPSTPPSTPPQPRIVPQPAPVADAARQPVRKIVEPRPAGGSSAGTERVRASEVDTLVVISKIKQLIRDRSEFNTSQCCIDALTEKVAEHCLRGIKEAEAAGRKTVMGRDIK